MTGLLIYNSQFEPICSEKKNYDTHSVLVHLPVLVQYMVSHGVNIKEDKPWLAIETVMNKGLLYLHLFLLPFLSFKALSLSPFFLLLLFSSLPHSFDIFIFF